MSYMGKFVQMETEKTENNRILWVSHWDVVVAMRPTAKTSQGKEVKRYLKEMQKGR